MKPSIYNFMIENGDNYLLYNAFSDSLTVLTPVLHHLYGEHGECMDRLKEVHPGFFQHMEQTGAIVGNEVDEAVEAVARLHDVRSKSTRFRLTVNPTMACNMRCWYCYEKKQPASISQETIRRIHLLLSEKLSAGSPYNSLLLSFFGGEPLLGYHSKAKVVLDQAEELCDRYGKEMSVHFTTNGYLITEEILQDLDRFHTTFQITLDGNEAVHNSVKQTHAGKQTYAKTVGNIIAATKHGCNVTVRLNYTQKSLPYFLDVIDDFEKLGKEQQNLLSFNFQHVWQDNKSGFKADEMEGSVHKMEREFIQAGLCVSPTSPVSFHCCYADCEDSLTVNYDGNVFRCTARDFTEANREGFLSEQGKNVWGNNHTLRLQALQTGKACKACSILPLCHGGCSQHKMEHTGSMDACVKGFTESDKLTVVHRRIRDILLENKLYHHQPS